MEIAVDGQLCFVVDARTAVIINFLAMLVSNLMAVRGFFGWDVVSTTRQLPTYVSQDSWTHTIWLVVWLLQALFVASQFCPSKVMEELFAGGARLRIAVAYLLNAMYWPLYCAHYHEVALLVLVAYLVVLLTVVSVFNSSVVDYPIQWLVFVAPHVISSSWVLIEVVDYSFAVLGLWGWKDYHGVAGSPRAALAVIMVLAFLAAWLSISRCEAAWALVVAWALAGMYRLQTVPDAWGFPKGATSELVAAGAQVGAIFTVAAAAVSIFAMVVKAPTVEYMRMDTEMVQA